jgi:hypothetical protein
MKDLPISDYTPNAKMEDAMNVQAIPTPKDEETPETRLAAIERQVNETGELFEKCRLAIRDMESEYAAARTALIDQSRRRFEDMQAAATEQLRALDGRYKRQIEKARQSLVAIARLRGEGNEN